MAGADETLLGAAELVGHETFLGTAGRIAVDTEAPSEAAPAATVRAALERALDVTDRAALDFHQQEGLDGRMWGVTRKQLGDFVSIVAALMAMNNPREIVQDPRSETAKFYSRDYGPNMHETNDGVIKPVTADPSRYAARFGNEDAMLEYNALVPKPPAKVSWALMLNPSGCECDLFVSHAWLECLYEFYRYLTRQWPSERVAAYICFLANPQNINPALFLGDAPDLSPFARALNGNGMRLCIIVANSTVPLHSRLWCVYEAFIASRLPLMVVIAGEKSNLVGLEARVRLSSLNKRVKVAGGMLLFFAAGFVCWIFLFFAQNAMRCFVGLSCLNLAFVFFFVFSRSIRDSLSELHEEIRQTSRDAICSDPEDQNKIRTAIDDQDQWDAIAEMIFSQSMTRVGHCVYLSARTFLCIVGVFWCFIFCIEVWSLLPWVCEHPSILSPWVSCFHAFKNPFGFLA